MKAQLRRLSDDALIEVTFRPGNNSYIWTEGASIVSNFTLDTSNLRNTYVSLANAIGRCKFQYGYNYTFWNTNNQLMYYYNIGVYCSGIYDVRTHVQGAKFNEQYNDEGKEIYAFLVLPSINSSNRNDLIGTEISIIGYDNTNVFVAPPSGGTTLEFYRNGSWSSGDSLSQYVNISTAAGRSRFFKIPAGVTKIICISDGAYGAKWFVE